MPGGQDEAARRGDAARSALEFLHRSAAVSRPPRTDSTACWRTWPPPLRRPAPDWPPCPRGRCCIAARPATTAAVGRRPRLRRPSAAGDRRRCPSPARPEARARRPRPYWRRRCAARPTRLAALAGGGRRPSRLDAAEAAALALAGQVIGRLLESGTEGALGRPAGPGGAAAGTGDRGRRRRPPGPRLRQRPDRHRRLLRPVPRAAVAAGLANEPLPPRAAALRQNGAQLTHLLRLFSRRQAGGVHPCETGGRRRRGSGPHRDAGRSLRRQHVGRPRLAAGRHRRRPAAPGAGRPAGKRPRRHAGGRRRSPAQRPHRPR